ncbi:unnamed protein product [Durusdinium trenchii]|uniref:Uncharacterized protein n=1 Tax=Durusdinium trenchii TaxID=1381693 RepID=A0ABP0JNW1_9DINO
MWNVEDRCNAGRVWCVSAMQSWTSLTALSIVFGFAGPNFLPPQWMQDAIHQDEGARSLQEDLSAELSDVPGSWALGIEEPVCWRQRFAPMAAGVTRWLEDCSEDSGVTTGTLSTLSFFFLAAAMDIAVLVQIMLRMLRWGRQKIGLAGQSIKPAPAANDVECSTQPAIVHQLRLPCHPEHFEIHSEDEETHTPRSTNADQDGTELRTPDSCCVSVELEDAYARIRTLESELHQQKQMSTALREEMRIKEVQADAHAVLQAELQVSRKELLECQGEANLMRVQLDALSELGSEKVPCTDCLSVFADWLKASLKDMAVQELHAKRAIHDSNHKQELRRQLDGLKIGRKQSSRWAPPSTSRGRRDLASNPFE